MSEISRLKWRCRRGVKELDIVLTHYLEKFYPQADQAEQQAFQRLLEIEDPELFACVTGKITWPDEEVQAIVMMLQTALISK